MLYLSMCPFGVLYADSEVESSRAQGERQMCDSSASCVFLRLPASESIMGHTTLALT
jgi:hypothetical protein